MLHLSTLFKSWEGFQFRTTCWKTWAVVSMLVQRSPSEQSGGDSEEKIRNRSRDSRHGLVARDLPCFGSPVDDFPEEERVQGQGQVPRCHVMSDLFSILPISWEGQLERRIEENFFYKESSSSPSSLYTVRTINRQLSSTLRCYQVTKSGTNS